MFVGIPCTRKYFLRAGELNQWSETSKPGDHCSIVLILNTALHLAGAESPSVIGHLGHGLDRN